MSWSNFRAVAQGRTLFGSGRPRRLPADCGRAARRFARESFQKTENGSSDLFRALWQQSMARSLDLYQLYPRPQRLLQNATIFGNGKPVFQALYDEDRCLPCSPPAFNRGGLRGSNLRLDKGRFPAVAPYGRVVVYRKKGRSYEIHARVLRQRKIEAASQSGPNILTRGYLAPRREHDDGADQIRAICGEHSTDSLTKGMPQNDSRTAACKLLDHHHRIGSQIVQREVLHRSHTFSDAAWLDTSRGISCGSQPFGKIGEITCPPSKARDHDDDWTVAINVKFDRISLSLRDACCWHGSWPGRTHLYPLFVSLPMAIVIQSAERRIVGKP
jgi:hypothetical protein